MMLSILIPTYNCNVVSLVEEIHSQASNCNIDFEVLIYDDASQQEFGSANKRISELSFCTYTKLDTNIGRSAIRNLLARNTKYDTLLFIDAGTFPKNSNFISNYLELGNINIATGGMTFLDNPPKKKYKLRWLYTKMREQNFINNKQQNSLFHSSNFLVQKWILKKFPFDESLTKYGYEDVVFSESLKESGIKINFINNPVVHNADDDAKAFINKTEMALSNLGLLVKNNKLDENASNILKTYKKMRSFGLDKLMKWGFKAFKPLMLLNLKSSNPSIKVFDIYRLGYFCSIYNN